MSDWPADPKIDASLRRLADLELARARREGFQMQALTMPRTASGSWSARGLLHLRRSEFALAGAAVAFVAVIAAGMAMRGAITGPALSAAPIAAHSPTPAASAAVSVLPSAAASVAASAAPASGSTSTSPLPSRSGHIVPTGSPNLYDAELTVLADGRVLAMGVDINSVPRAEIYDPRTGRFTETGRPPAGHFLESGVVLTDGRVLFAGGTDGNSTLAASFLYDPRTGKFIQTGSLHTSRMGHTASLLPDGRVLIAGGGSISGSAGARPGGDGTLVEADRRASGPSSLTPRYMTGPEMLTSTEIYNPKTGKFTIGPSMVFGHDAASATTLKDGRILIAGGGNEGSAAIASAEIYNPRTNKFTATGSMLEARYGHTGTLLPDGRVLITGGTSGDGSLNTFEVYNPVTGQFKAAPMKGAVNGYPAVVVLKDGHVLLIGGYTGTANSTECEFYDPSSGKLTPVGNLANSAYDSAVLLRDGRVLIIEAAYGDPAENAKAELYIP